MMATTTENKNSILSYFTTSSTTPHSKKIVTQDGTHKKLKAKKSHTPKEGRKTLQTLQIAADNTGLNRLGSTPKIEPVKKVVVFQDADQPQEQHTCGCKCHKHEDTENVNPQDEGKNAEQKPEQKCEQAPEQKEKTAEEEALELMGGDTIPESYWECLAEERRSALAASLEENEKLHELNSSLREENESLKSHNQSLTEENVRLTELTDQAEEMLKMVAEAGEESNDQNDDSDKTQTDSKPQDL